MIAFFLFSSGCLSRLLRFLLPAMMARPWGFSGHPGARRRGCRLALLAAGLWVGAGGVARAEAVASGWVDCASRPVTPPTSAFRIAAVGDLTFSGEEAGNVGAMQPFTPVFRNAHFVFANLEGAITERQRARKPYIPGKSYPFRFPAQTANLLARLPVHAVGIANNHSYDYDTEGLQDTLRYLSRAGVAATGMAGKYIVERRGGKRVALLAFSPYARHNHIRRLPEAKRLVRRARAEADLVVVSFHGGAEGDAGAILRGRDETYAGEARGNPRTFARAVVEAGADLVVGHGPHVLRPLECHQGKLAAYSLGNFVAAGGLSTRNLANVTAVLEAALDPDTGRLVAVRLWPATFNARRLPVPDPSGRAVWLVNWLGRQSARHVPGLRPLELSGFATQARVFDNWLATTSIGR